ncbi:hypothetical protein [Bacillus xiapuensis]|uniref:Uncharacterized protein n=1 Tax=Bacillus xiapuensis TaxID=2014075 RepID=A0ABU6NC68_9BACI|nr:hypothetical protein [Bacillus xiapuensis]
MALWWATAIGFLICLGFIFGSYILAMRRALDTEDSTRIDPIPSNQDDSSRSQSQSQ